MRPLATLLVTPSVDLSELARQHQKDMPYLIQYFVNGLGRDAVSCADLMSYLLFTPRYTRALIDIGYNDANNRIDEIEDFIFSPLDSAGRFNGDDPQERNPPYPPGSRPILSDRVATLVL